MASRLPTKALDVAPAEWATFKRQPGLVLGFHGCDRETAEAVLAGRARHLHKSKNEYDWLGSGVYFWENDPWRALDFATEARDKRHLTQGTVGTPCVIGAVLDLGLCLNLLEIEAVREVANAHAYLAASLSFVPDGRLPKNTGHEMGARYLDKAVIETVHQLRERYGMESYNTVRAAFMEGEPLYDGAGFRRKSHIQIAVRDEANIKGYFRLHGL